MTPKANDNCNCQASPSCDHSYCHTKRNNDENPSMTSSLIMMTTTVNPELKAITTSMLPVARRNRHQGSSCSRAATSFSNDYYRHLLSATINSIKTATWMMSTRWTKHWWIRGCQNIYAGWPRTKRWRRTSYIQFHNDHNLYPTGCEVRIRQLFL